jgi:predicted secreted protein
LFEKGLFSDNHNRLLSEVAEVAFKLRAELCERSFALVLDRGGMRPTGWRGRANVQNATSCTSPDTTSG